MISRRFIKSMLDQYYENQGFLKRWFSWIGIWKDDEEIIVLNSFYNRFFKECGSRFVSKQDLFHLLRKIVYHSLNDSDQYFLNILLIELKRELIVSIFPVSKSDVQKHIQNISHGMCRLFREDLFTLENCRIILTHLQEVYRLSIALSILNRNQCLTLENKNIILVHFKYADRLANAIVLLTGRNILTWENRESLSQHSAYAYNVSEGLVILSQQSLLTEENKATILEHPQYADRIARAIVLLFRKGNVTPENRMALVEGSRFAEDIARVLNLLLQTDLLAPENISSILQYVEYIFHIISTLSILRCKGLLTQNHLNILFSVYRKPEYIEGIDNVFNNWEASLDAECFDLIAYSTQYAPNIARSWFILCAYNLRTQRNKEALYKHAQYSDSLSKALELLASERLLNQKNFNLLCLSARYMTFVAGAIMVLKEAKVFDQIWFKDIISDPKNALFMVKEYSKNGFIASARQKGYSKNSYARDFFRIRSHFQCMRIAAKRNGFFKRIPDEIFVKIVAKATDMFNEEQGEYILHRSFLRRGSSDDI